MGAQRFKVEVVTVVRLNSLLKASGFLVCAGCSSGDPTLPDASEPDANSDSVSASDTTIVSGVGGTARNGESVTLPTTSTGGWSASPTPATTPITGGSMAATGGASSVPATGGVHDHAAVVAASALTVEEPTCGVHEFDRKRKPAEVLLVIDRSLSMKDDLETGVSKWEAIVPTVTGVIQSTNSEIWWGVKSYPEGGRMCAPESTVHVPIAEDNAASVIAEIGATSPSGLGTPTGDAIRVGLGHLLDRAAISENPKFILLATDGEPNCDGDDGLDAIEYAIAQIEAALAAGFPTYVLGVDTTSSRAIENLNAMAEAGGRPRPPGSVNPLDAEDARFYLASTQAEMEAAFWDITGGITSCVFDLDPPPPVPDNIAVDFNGVRTERDPARENGWEYTTDDHTQIEVYGAWCERIKTEASNQVNIKYGCPGVPIPLPG